MLSLVLVITGLLRCGSGQSESGVSAGFGTLGSCCGLRDGSSSGQMIL